MWAYRVGANDVIWLMRQLAILLCAGIALLQALDCLSRGQSNLAIRRLINRLRHRLEEGASFAQALGSYPHLFDSWFAYGVAAGEQGGTLDITLERLARQLEKTRQLQRKIKNALIYPCSIVLTAVVVVAIILIQVIPGLSDIFQRFGVSLPYATRQVIAFSTFLRDYALYSLTIMIALVLHYRFLQRNHPLWQAWRERFVLRLPLVGAIVQRVALARWARTLSILMTAGVPVIDAVSLAGYATGQILFCQTMPIIEAHIRAGKSLHQALAISPLFSPLLLQMIAVGEESGTLDGTLEKVAQYYEEDVDNKLMTLTSLFEPIAMALLGIGVGLLVWALYLPIFQLGQIIA